MLVRLHMVANIQFLLLLLSRFTLEANSDSTTTPRPPVIPCVPYISEISNTSFGNSKSLQYIELQVPEKCRTNRKAMQEMAFSDYGLVIMHTKSRERGSDQTFEVRTFVKFSKCVWPKKHHDSNAKKGGLRIADSFRAFFVIGGPASLAPSLTPTDRVGKAIEWDMYEPEIGVKCGSLVNWPCCEQDIPQGQGFLDQFLVRQPPTSVALSIPSEKELLQGQTVFVLVKFDHDKRKEEADYFSREFSYVQFDAGRNKYFAADKLQVSKEKQEWLSSRAKEVVVFTPSIDESEALPLHRLKHLFARVSPMVVHVLPPHFTGLKSDESISRCSEEDHVFAITKRSPGSDNLCDDDIEYLQKTSIENVCEQEGAFELNTEFEDVPMDVAEAYEPYTDVIMDMDVDVDVPTTSHGSDDHLQLKNFCHGVIRKLEKNQLTMDRLVKGTENLQEGICIVNANLKQVEKKVDKQEELRKEVEAFNTAQVRRKYGMNKDPQLRRKLERLGDVGIKFGEKQLDHLSKWEWLEVTLDESDLKNSFFRCKVCNRNHPVKDVASEFSHCSRIVPSHNDGRRTNMMGVEKVLCVKQFENLADGNKGWAYAVARVVNRHAEAKEHQQAVNSYYEALGASRLGNPDLAVAATVLSTLSAYTIAKEGLPLSSQFPLLLFGLRGGAPVGTTHYEATSARRMIYNFATHIEYELFRYLIENDLPFSILMDGSSSTRGTKWMAYMLRSLTPSFEPYTFHLLLAEVARETGESITEVLLSHFEERSSWLETPGLASSPHDFLMKRLISITTDGASTMVGRADGVYGRLQRHIREDTQTSSLPRTSLLLSVCAAHKLNIALKDVKHTGYTLGRALIMEMHAIFGATQSSSARRHYKNTAFAMAFKQLQMGQFFAIRWSDSFRHGLSNVLRMWPVLIESLNRVGMDRGISANTRTRAKIASWVMRDARVFLMMKHVLQALDRVSSLSLFFQKTDCLAVDAMEAARATVRSLQDDSLTNELLEELIKPMSVLNLFDGYRRKLLSKQFLLNYYTISVEADTQSGRWRLGYLPKQFKDFKAKDTNELTEEEERLMSELTSFKHFRSLKVISDDEELFETVDFESDNLRFNRDDSPDIDFDVSLDYGLGYTYRKFLYQLGVKGSGSTKLNNSKF